MAHTPKDTPPEDSGRTVFIPREELSPPSPPAADEVAGEANAPADASESAPTEPVSAAAPETPSAEPAPPEPPPPEPTAPEPPAPQQTSYSQATIFAGGSLPPPGPNSAFGSSTPPPTGGTGGSFGAFNIPSSGGRVAIGSVLNHIYEVRRFIARGGMGEVYEGVNVNTDERVAIKVILQHLAEDPKVQALFRREARTLTRLTHPALVQYRVLAQEPTLGVLYIVTEYVDGVGLDESIGEIHPTEAELRGLTRRLAEGLKAAHELGAIHRDISPDNILLPNKRLDTAKIIDFGIAKDIETSQATIVGDGFAGKLGFVAPEQFGDFGREIGPWTDVYSLALVILSIAAGKPIDMGSTLVEAVDRRRAGPDLSALPNDLRPIFARMLEPDPKNRFRSMDEVLAALDGVVDPNAPAGRRSGGTIPPTGGSGGGQDGKSGEGRGPPVGLMIGGGAALVIVIVAVIGLIIARSGHNGASAGLTASAEATMDTALRTTPCAWLTDRMSRAPDGLHIEFNGAAGDPAGAVTQVTQALEKAGAKVAGSDRSKLRTLPSAACENVSAVAQFHAASSEDNWIEPQASLFHFQSNGACGNDPNQATSVITVKPPAPGQDDDVALFRMEDTGAMTRIFAGLSEFKRMTASGDNGKGYLFEDLGGQGIRVSLCEKTPGLKGVLLVRGKAPFELGVPPLTAADTASPAGVAARFIAAGKAQNWRTQMAWYGVDSGAPAAAGGSIPGVAAAPPGTVAAGGSSAKPASARHASHGDATATGDNGAYTPPSRPAAPAEEKEAPTTF
ncbi:MAG: protein kinase [Caulobacteraceae bacterium]|nr:protein kinase [Caulobacteraceae bacterium]